jgi:hypothetical protein
MAVQVAIRGPVLALRQEIDEKSAALRESSSTNAALKARVACFERQEQVLHEALLSAEVSLGSSRVEGRNLHQQVAALRLGAEKAGLSQRQALDEAKLLRNEITSKTSTWERQTAQTKETLIQVHHLQDALNQERAQRTSEQLQVSNRNISTLTPDIIVTTGIIAALFVLQAKTRLSSDSVVISELRRQLHKQQILNQELLTTVAQREQHILLLKKVCAVVAAANRLQLDMPSPSVHYFNAQERNRSMDRLTQAREELDLLKPSKGCEAKAAPQSTPRYAPCPRGTVSQAPCSAPPSCRIPRFIAGKSTPIRLRRRATAAAPCTSPAPTLCVPQHPSPNHSSRSSPESSQTPPSGVRSSTSVSPSLRSSTPSQSCKVQEAKGVGLSPWDSPHHPLRGHMQRDTATSSLARKLFTQRASGDGLLATVLSKQVQGAKEHMQGLQWELQEAKHQVQRAHAERDAAITRFRNGATVPGPILR